MITKGLHDLGVSVLTQAKQDFGATPRGNLTATEIAQARSFILGHTEVDRYWLHHWCALAEMMPETVMHSSMQPGSCMVMKP